MHKRTLKVALLVTLAIIMVFGLSTVAFASAWPDLPASVTAKYAITGDQVAGISDGFANGLWKPYINVTRAQFTKMAVAAFKIPLANPATATYSDVPKGSFYYQYIEGATAAGMTNGFGGATFKPGDPITREQAIAIVVRWVAKVNGYNLATQYTAAQITALLAPFPDAAAVNLKPEVAFAIDFGITVGNAYGKLDPASNMTRIQGAAFLIRAITMIPAIPVKVSKLEIVSGDKGENLIGQNHMVTFKATKADGTPAVGALVDFDTLVGPEFMVGNISPQAAMTDKFGQVTVNLIATEPGTENVSASVPGLAAVVATKYWLALDEVYTIAANDGFMSSDGSATPVQNNAGTTHDWSVRVTVFGPGPLSTSPQDWYNAITTAPVDPTNLKPTDAIDASYVYGTYDWSYAFEQTLALDGYVPRTLPGVTVNWSILPLLPDMTSTGGVITNASGVTITSLTPGAGVAAGGTSVVITGTGFTGATAVHFGAVPATSYVVNSATRITAIAPAGIVNTTVYVMVTTPTGTNLGYGADQYTYGVAPVGTISAITNSGTIATGGQTASGPTDANGLSMITITSNKTGLTATQAVATYAGNPYPGDLFSHRTFSNLNHHLDWEPQPSVTQLKQWIPHTLPVSTGPLSLASSKDNTGEDELATLTLVDVLGNFIPGYQVEWTVQGVGILKNAQTVTDVTGKATATLYSSEPGQSILEAKVLDKSGTPAYVYTATKQWYQIDSVAFTPASLWALNPNGTLAVGTPVSNVVNNPHTFNLKVSGLKWVWTSTDVNNTGLHDNQALVISRDSAFAAAGTIINEDGTLGAAKPASQDLPVQTVMQVTIGNGTFYVTRFADATLQPGEYWANMMNTPVIGVQLLWSGLAGKGVDFFNNIGDADATSAAENFGAPVSNTSITPPLLFGDTRTVGGFVLTGDGTNGMPEFVGTITGSTAPYTSKVYGGTTYKYDAVTDANGMATVTVNSTVKGDQYIYAVADYPGNPQSSGQSSIPALSGDLPLNWSQLRFATAEKVWLANATGAATYKVFGMHGEDESAGTIIDGNSYTNPILPFAGYTVTGSATVTIAPPAAGTLATGHATVAAGAVTGILVDTAGTGYTAADIGRALTIGPPIAVGSGATATATLGTAPSTGNTVGLISVTAGGTGYATAPTVNISAPNITGGTQATATATLGGTSVVSVTIATAGSGYTSAPTVTFSTGTQAAATITTLAANGVATVTVTVPGTGYPTAPTVTFPAPLKVRATATATIAGGVVTALTFVAPGFAGSGYITAPVVTISGTGTGAAAHATVNADSTITLVLTAGGSFTGGTTTEPTSANLNRETLGVQVVDQFGNALPDYKVKWQIVQQGTTTSGTVPTYHPYAHFEDAEHSMSEEPNETTLDHESFVNDVAGIGDINSHVDINPIWNYGGSTNVAAGSDDLAWGYTLNGGVNGVESFSSAANVQLVLDDSPATLAAMAAGTEFSDIVNVTIYKPDGSLFDNFTVVKNWSFAAPVPTTKVLSISTTATGPWSTSLTTNLSPLYARVQVLDQYGNPWVGVDPTLSLLESGSTVSVVYLNTIAASSQGFVIGPFTLPAGGLWTLTAWNDTLDPIGSIQVGEIQSNQATVTYTGGTPAPF